MFTAGHPGGDQSQNCRTWQGSKQTERSAHFCVLLVARRSCGWHNRQSCVSQLLCPITHHGSPLRCHLPSGRCWSRSRGTSVRARQLRIPFVQSLHGSGESSVGLLGMEPALAHPVVHRNCTGGVALLPPGSVLRI